MTDLHKAQPQRVRIGPLAYRRCSDGCDDLWDIYRVSDGIVITSIPFWDCDSEWMTSSEAAARLFVASPELLEALEYLLEQTVDMDAKHGIDLSEGEADAREQALTAIAKARG